MANGGSFIAAGDLFITRRLPENGYKGFWELQNLIRKQDVKFVNLEVTFHDREGYPFGFSGGTWAMAAPELLEDVKKFGFNIYNSANNHSMDYSHNGLLATMRNLKKEKMNFAGIGENLADAAAPAYIETENMRVALIAATSTFHESWAAGNQRMDMKGRPGVNPLKVRTRYHVEEANYQKLREIADEVDINAQYNLDVKEGFTVPKENCFQFGSHEFIKDNRNYKETVPDQTDQERIIASIKEARKQSDFVMVSIHSHEINGEDKERPAQFLQVFARACIDAGAAVILGHGPHLLRGIELYHGGVIFYSLGNFLFENDTTTHQPADFYEKYHMPGDGMVGGGMDCRSHNGTIGLGTDARVWHSCIANWQVRDGKMVSLSMYPIGLGDMLPRYRKGLPALCECDEVLEHLADLSREFGTKMDIRDHVGIVRLETAG